MNVIPSVISLVSSLVLVVLTFKINKILNKKDETVTKEKNQSQAIADGVQCLLRDSIVRDFNKYTERGFCPIYAKETIKRAYKAYHALDGNDVATELYNKILEMPEEKKE
jgi:hypothetical protein